MGPEARLRELGFELPEISKPVVEYAPAKRLGGAQRNYSHLTCEDKISKLNLETESANILKCRGYQYVL